LSHTASLLNGFSKPRLRETETEITKENNAISKQKRRRKEEEEVEDKEEKKKKH
jgi:hypothetical protein